MHHTAAMTTCRLRGAQPVHIGNHRGCMKLIQWNCNHYTLPLHAHIPPPLYKLHHCTQ